MRLMRELLKKTFFRLFPAAKRLQRQRDELQCQRDELQRQRDELMQEVARLEALLADLEHQRSLQPQYSGCLDTLAHVLQYRLAYFETNGATAPDGGIPSARAWPERNEDISYRDKLLGCLDIDKGRGAEIGPLNIPLTSKDECDVLYVDHLDTKGLREKYPTVQDIAEIDRPMINDSIKDTLLADAPLDYIVASQVFEHVPNPIRWLQEIASVLRPGGRVALSIPDRRRTFDLLREETRAADIVAAYLEDSSTPNVRCVYDYHSLASFVNMTWATPESVLPEEVVSGGGAIRPKNVTDEPMALTNQAKGGEYLDVHAWVFTPPSFLLVMARIAGEGFLPFRLHQFYPTNMSTPDRDNHSFTVVLEKDANGTSIAEMRRSYLRPLG